MASAAAVIGFLSLLFSASGAFGELQDAMNLIWRVKPPQGRPILTMLRERFFSFTMVLSCGFLLLVSLVISAVLAGVSNYISDGLPLAVIAMHMVNLAVSFCVITCLFALIFKTVPDASIPCAGVWGGAILTTILFITGKALIGLYLGARASRQLWRGRVDCRVAAVDLLFGADPVLWRRITHVYQDTYIPNRTSPRPRSNPSYKESNFYAPHALC